VGVVGGVCISEERELAWICERGGVDGGAVCGGSVRGEERGADVPDGGDGTVREGGRIELMGGKESQVKIRSHRIEVGR